MKGFHGWWEYRGMLNFYFLRPEWYSYGQPWIMTGSIINVNIMDNKCKRVWPYLTLCWPMGGWLYMTLSQILFKNLMKHVTIIYLTVAWVNLLFLGWRNHTHKLKYLFISLNYGYVRIVFKTGQKWEINYPSGLSVFTFMELFPVFLVKITWGA